MKAERRTGASSDGSYVLIAEVPTGSFSRRLFLGETLDTDRIAASYDGGVLRLTMVAERAKPRRSTSEPETAHPRRSTSERQRSRKGPALWSRICNTRLKGASDDTGGRH
ncbi:Hsp20/alpha crystallin family protein [Streptomyces sp. NPDC056255]|uniref:Hsp20/alpha crystallin family protein n=1 Tax=Streptomyces sp. NPDC056255 TaxID=3345764 RepID=UPI0035D5894B